MSLFWLSLAIFVLAPLAAFVYVVTKGLQLWRSLKEFFAATGAATAELTASAERLAAFEPPDLERAAASFGRLQRSNAELSVLTSAFARAREQLLGFTVLYPKK